MAEVLSSTFQGRDEVLFPDLLQAVNEGEPTDSLFGTAEATEFCEMMNADEEIMFSGGIVYPL